MTRASADFRAPYSHTHTGLERECVYVWYLICVLLRGSDTIFTLGDLMVALLTALFLPQIAREHGIRFFETSAKANINIEKAFLTLAEDILKKVGAPWALAWISVFWTKTYIEMMSWVQSTPSVCWKHDVEFRLKKQRSSITFFFRYYFKSSLVICQRKYL